MREFNPGFRLSLTDIIVLIVGLSICAYMYSASQLISYIVGCVVFHFFIFCNIVRMSRIPELIWSVVFISIVWLSSSFEELSGLIAILIVFACTVLLVILEIMKPSYHGFMWQKLNPSLPQWFESNNANK